MPLSTVWRTCAIAFLATTPLAVTLADSDFSGARRGAATYVSRDEMRDWLGNGERGIWIEAGELWFYASFKGLCRGLSSTNALHFAFRTCATPRTRLLVLLQAVAWAADKTGGDLAGKALRPIRISELGGASVPARAEDAVADIFALVPSRTYRWDAKAKKAVLTYGERADADQACRKVFALARERPEAAPLFAQTAHSWLCRKASTDHHEYKFLAAILEDASRVSPAWQPHLLAASVHYFHGKQTPDNPVVMQAREELRKIG